MRKHFSAIGRLKQISKCNYGKLLPIVCITQFFMGVTSLLIKDGHKVSTHKGVVMSFGLYYVTTGVMTNNEGRLYSQLQVIREKG